jgi:hypothetical protein
MSNVRNLKVGEYLGLHREKYRKNHHHLRWRQLISVSHIRSHPTRTGAYWQVSTTFPDTQRHSRFLNKTSRQYPGQRWRRYSRATDVRECLHPTRGAASYQPYSHTCPTYKSNRIVRRRLINQTMSHYVIKYGNNWDEFIDSALMLHRVIPHSITATARINYCTGSPCDSRQKTTSPLTSLDTAKWQMEQAL